MPTIARLYVAAEIERERPANRMSQARVHVAGGHP